MRLRCALVIENEIQFGPPIHDDLPCALMADESTRNEIAKALTQRIRDNVPNYEHVLVDSELYVTPKFERGIMVDLEAARKIFAWFPH